MRISLALLSLAAVAAAADPARIFYSKSFPGSTPAYVEIVLERDGSGLYKEAPDDELPLKFKLAESEAGEIFSLGAKLDWFARQLESPAKVAFMGKKTFRVDEPKKNEVQFNYSEDLDARALQDWFERMAESAVLRVNLERAAKYDRLGVNKALLQLESWWDRKRLAGPGQFLPVLDRIAKNESYLHMARQRAAKLADAIRAPAPASQETAAAK